MKILMIILCSIMLLNAENVKSISKLTLQDAILLVKKNNLQIKMANFDQEIANANIKKAEAQNFGTLNFIQKFARSDNALSVFGFKLTSRKANFGDFGAQQFMRSLATNNPNTYTAPPNNLNYPGDYNFFQSSLRYEVPLFTGFKLTSYKHIEKAIEKMKNLDKTQLTHEKIFQIKKTYYSLSLLSHTIAQMNIILKNIKRLEDTSKAMVKEGYATNIDVLEVQAKLANVLRLINQMQANQTLLYQYLSFLLNQKVTSIVLPPQDVTMIHLTDKEILAHNIDIQKAKNGLAIGHNLVTISKASYYPAIGAFAQVSTADNTFLGDADKHKAYTIGAKLTWNIFNGGADSAMIQKAEIEQLKASTGLDLAKQAMLLKVEKIKTQIKSDNYEIASLKQGVKLATAIYNNYVGRYHEKLVSINDVIIKQTKKIQIVLKLQKIRNKRNNSIFKLEQISNQGQS